MDIRGRSGQEALVGSETRKLCLRHPDCTVSNRLRSRVLEHLYYNLACVTNFSAADSTLFQGNQFRRSFRPCSSARESPIRFFTDSRDSSSGMTLCMDKTPIGSLGTTINSSCSSSGQGSNGNSISSNDDCCSSSNEGSVENVEEKSRVNNDFATAYNLLFSFLFYRYQVKEQMKL
ncbi:unnamed protein product [Protopolystoma xenopodis]|uniref:Uncharacterized protein n=1 Tax=Protopolystoma xenopodis TaxID=117903 RepID=A0A3S4ZZB8_9PLAT|nr:unnamed protein product [Protopolystoma xenopodis]